MEAPNSPDTFPASRDFPLVGQEDAVLQTAGGEVEEEGRGDAEEDGSDVETTSLITTGAATWCLHAAAASTNADALLAAFTQLLNTHHTLQNERASSSSPAELLSPHRPPFTKRATADGDVHVEGDERTAKREDTAVAVGAAGTNAVSQNGGRLEEDILQQAATTSSLNTHHIKEDESAGTAASCEVAVPGTSRKEPIRSSSIGTTGSAGEKKEEEAEEDAVPYFPVYEAILQNDWKDECVKRGKTRKQKKRSGARVPNAAVAFSREQETAGFRPEEDSLQPQGGPDTSHSYAIKSHVPLSEGTAPERKGRSPYHPPIKETPPIPAVAGPQQVLQQGMACIVDGITTSFPGASVAAVPVAATPTQWRFTFFCRVCGRSCTIEEQTARCSMCLLACNTTQQVRKDSTEHVTTTTPMWEPSRREALGDSTPCDDWVRESLKDRNAVSAGTTGCYDKQSGSSSTDYTTCWLNEEERTFEDLLLPPAVPVSSALYRISPETVRLWHLRSHCGDISHSTQTFNLIDEAPVSRSAKRSDDALDCSLTDTTSSANDDLRRSPRAAVSCCEEAGLYTEDRDYQDGREVYELLKIVKPRKSRASRRQKMENDVHVRAQLACLVEGSETNARNGVTGKLHKPDEAAEGAPQHRTAERPEARKLTSAVIQTLKKLPKHERGKDAFFELLLAWYYAGFFTGRLSMCSNGRTLA